MAGTLTGVDPRTGETVGTGIPEAGPEEARAAAAAAADAFRLRPAPGAPGSFDDAVLLEAVAGGLEDAAGELVEVAGRETGLAQERLRGEVARTVNQLRAFAAARREGLLADAIIDTARPDAAPPRPDQRRVAVPLGPVAVFSASNFPFAFSTAGGDTASAFAAGCPVILKAHPAHPVTSHVTGQAVSSAVRAGGAPDEWFQLLQGAGVELGQALATADDVAAVAFTGSLRAGRALVDAAARRDVPIPVFAEMGSINPLVVTPAALERRGGEIGQSLAGAVLGSAGQLCTKPNLVLAVEGPGLDDLVGALAEALRAAGDLVMLTTRLRDGFAASWQHLREDGHVRELVPASVRRTRRRLAVPRPRDRPRRRSPAAAGPARGALRPRHGRRRRPGRRGARPARRDPARHAHRDPAGRGRRGPHPGGTPAGHGARRARGEDDLERLADRRDGRARDGARRALPRHERPGHDERGDDGRPAVPAGGRVPGVAGRDAAGRAAGRQPARHRPARRRHLHPGPGGPGPARPDSATPLPGPHGLAGASGAVRRGCSSRPGARPAGRTSR